MAEMTLCEKKPKKARKKKHEFLAIVPEETLSLQDLDQICQDAAEAFYEDVASKAVHSNPISTHELFSEEQAECTTLDEPEFSIDLKTKDLGLLEIPLVRSELEVGSTLCVDKMEAESKFYADEIRMEVNMIAAAENVTLLDKDVLDDLDNKLFKESSLSLKDSSFALQTTKRAPSIERLGFGEKEQGHAQTLKPSVFVGRDKMYNSSLQIGCHWDRTKYNIVLLPDISKVVYPDLDALLFNKPSTDPFIPRNNPLFGSVKGVDRSSKPNKTLPVINTGYNEMSRRVTKVPSFDKDIKDFSTKVEKLNVDYQMETKDNRYTDYIIDGVDFRVFMNPVKWSPVDNCQLVIFRVGPLFYEEFFINCATTEGLIHAVKERAKDLSKHQLLLTQTCLQSEFAGAKSFRLPNATLVIYGNPRHFDWTAEWHNVRFGVNEGFYEEKFQGCKSFEDLVRAVKHRAEIVCAQQRALKAQAYSLNETIADNCLGSMMSTKNDTSDTFLSIDKNCFENDTESKLNGKNEAGTSHDDSKADTSSADAPLSQEAQKSKGFKAKFKSLQKWLKGTILKKAGKAEKDNTQGGGGGSKEIVWQWNDSPEAASSALLQDGSENVKE